MKSPHRIFTTVLIQFLVLALIAPMLLPGAVFSAGNTAPTLDNSGQPYFDPGFQNHVSPLGTSVSAMLATGAGGAPITDSDGDDTGIAVIWADNANGTWQFSTSGLVWSDFPAQSIPSPVSLGSLGSGGITINGLAAQDQAGWSVSSAGDVNNDGIDDIIIGANQADAPGRANSGISYVIFGSTAPAATIDLNALNGSNGFALYGATAGDYSAHAVTRAGDLNGDGIDDIAISALHAANNAGRVYVVFGKSSFAATLDLGSLGAGGITLTGSNAVEADNKAGYAISSAGDVNGDGVDDLLIGAPFADPDPNGEYDAGQVYLIYGSTVTLPTTIDLGSLDGSNGMTINGVVQSDYAGWSVSGAGDVNGDGFDDMLIGASDADPNGAQSGAAYLLFGRDTFTTTVNLAGLDGSSGTVLNGEAEWDKAGWSVSGAGDINGDGYDDVLIGATQEISDTGRSYVLFGHSSPFATSLNLGSLNGSNGFALHGINPGDFSGQAVSGAGDVNGDGLADLLVGAKMSDPGNLSAAGQSYLLLGSREAFSASISLSSLNGSNGVILNGGSIGEQAGYAVSSAGDFNGDGLADLLVGAPYATPGAVTNGGRSYVVFSRPKATVLNAGSTLNKIRFVPAAGFTGTASLLFRAWDTTDGAVNGSTVVIGGTGGSFAYSSATEQATITVLDAPPDLGIAQTVTPGGSLQPGQTITATLVYSNSGAQLASGVVITSPMPALLENISVTSSGAAIAASGSSDFVWSVADLAVDAGGSITITGQISPNLAADTSFSLTADIGANQLEAITGNNQADSGSISVTLPRVYFGSTTYVVGETAGSISVPARLNVESGQTVTVDYATSNGSATAGSDYEAISGTLTFSPGTTVQTITITILDDFLDESSETINLTLSQPFRAIVDQTGQTQVSITNNDHTITGLSASNSGPTALGATTSLTATITAGNDVSYAWNFGDGASGSGSSASHTYAAAGSYTAVVTASNAVNQVTGSTTVVVQVPVAGLSADNSSPVQLGQATSFTASVTAGTDVTYQWNFADGNSGSGANASHTYGAVGSYNVTVTAKNGVSQQSTQTAVTVEDVPISGLQASNNGPTELFKLTTLSASVAAGSNVVYSWDFGDGSASGSGATVSHNYPDSLGVYTATVTASNGANLVTDTTVITIVDVSIAGLSLTSNAPRIHNQTTSFNSSITAGTNVTYLWNFGDGTTPQVGGASTSYLYTAPGSYTVVLTATNGRGSKTASKAVVISPRTCWVRLNDSATDYFYVQDAITASSQASDVVKVAGTCTGIRDAAGNLIANQLAMLNQTLTLRGGYTSTNWTTPDPVANPTTLNATNEGRVLVIAGSISPVIEGLTLTGGNASGQGGSANGDVGGGVYVYNGATPTLKNNTITGNSADQGGGIWLMQSSGLISGNVISNNTAVDQYGDGGGLYVYQGAATVRDNTITSNNASRWGGGLYFFQGATQFFRNTLASNSATSGGGGLYTFDSTGVITHNVFSQNSGAAGGGLYLHADQSSFDGNTLSNNSATNGGGLYMNQSDNTLTNNFIVNNQATTAGSGIYVYLAKPIIGHSTIVSNSGAAAVYIKSTSSNRSDVSLVNNILVGHTEGLRVDSYGRAELSGTLWGSGSWANGTDWTGPGTVVTGTINVWADPAFVDPANGDYHLQAGSPAIDQGATAVATVDFDGSRRPAGGGFELGADEFPVALTVVQHATPNPVEPGSQLRYTLTVSNVESFNIPTTINFTPPAAVTPNTPQNWTPTLGDGGAWSAQLTVTVNANAVGPLVSQLEALSAEGDFINNYSVGVERAVTDLVIANSSPTLLGNTTAMTATAGGDNVQFAWAFGDGASGSGATLTHTYAAAGNYPVTVTASNGVSVVSATMTAVVETTVAGLKVTYLSPAELGQPVNFAASVTGGNNISYTWNFGDGASGSGSSVSHAFSTVGNHVITVTAANHVSQQSKTVQLQVQQPITGLTAASSSPTLLGSTTTLTAAITAGSHVSYQWNFGDGQTGSGANPGHVYGTVGSYTARVTASNGVSSQVATTTVTITNVPISGLTASNNGPTTINRNTGLSAAISAGTNVTYQWNFGDGTSASGKTPSHKYAAVGVYTATVTASNSASTHSASTVVHVIDETITGLALTSNSSPDNLGETTTLGCGVTTGSNITYSWDFGDGGSGSGQNVSHVYSSGGSFVVTLTATNSLSSQTITRTVIINRPPAALLSLSPISGTLETLITADASASSDPDGDVISYTFNFGGEKIIGPQSSPTAAYRFRTGGTRQVQVTVSDGEMSHTATQAIEIEMIPLLAIAKTGPAQVYAGDFITYTLTITNTTLPPGSSPEAELVVSPTDLNFHSTEGGSPPAGQLFTISNGGSGELAWLVRKSASWLSLSQPAGSGPGTVNVAVDISGLTPGVYQDQITVDAGLARNGLQTVDATLTLFCTGRQPVDVMLALDKSGSMYGQPFSDAQQAVKKFVGLMDLSTDQVGLVSFASLATVDNTLGRNAEAIKARVDGLSAGGLTNIAEAINDAHLELMSQRHLSGNTPVMIVLSDGMQTVAGDPLAEAAEAKADGIRIISIGLGYADVTTLRDIASAPGDYYYAPTSDELSLIYNRIAVDVGCPGSSAALSLSAAAETDSLAPVYRTMPVSASADPLDAATAYNLVITDALPAGATYVDGGANNGGVISWSIGQLPPNTSVQVSFVVRATETITNDTYGVTAAGGFSATGNQNVVTTISQRPVPALSLTKTASTSQVVGAADVIYTYVVRNTGTALLSNISLDDDKLGFVGGREELQVGASWQITKTGLIVEDTTNVATVSATSAFGPATAADSAFVDFVPNWLCGATIRSAGNGNWKDASTWRDSDGVARIPGNSDIVLVQSDHTVIIQATARTNIQALCNYGTLRSTEQQQLHILADDFLHNYGTIESTDGAGGLDKTCGHPANNLKLTGSPIINWGVIQAGDGGDGEKCGGRGGSVMVMGLNTTNYGTICAGQGGDVLGTGKAASSHSGKGGDTHVWGNHGGAGMLRNTGLLCAGDGGNGNPAATGEQRGGDGGDLKIISEPDVILSGGRYYAGRGGTGTGGGKDGRDGRVFIEPVTIDLSGAATEVRGGDIIIFGGDGATLDLSNMDGAAIEASGDIVVAVGADGSVNLQNNGLNSDVFKAGGEMQVAADTILLDSGLDLADVVAGNVSDSTSKLLRDVSLGAPTRLSGAPGATLDVTVSVLNSGPADDIYELTQTSAGIWTAGALPPTQPVGGLDTEDVPLTLAIPTDATVGGWQVVTITATSQNDPAISAVAVIEIEVVTETTGGGGSSKVYLPVVIK